MGPLLNSALVRATGVLLSVGVLFILLMAWALFAPVGRERADLYVLPLPVQSAAIVDVLDSAPLQLRPRVLDALNSRALSVIIVADLPRSVAQSSRPAPIMSNLFTAYGDVFHDREFHLILRQRTFLSRLFHRHVNATWEPSKIYVRLLEGGYVLIEPARAVLFDGFLARAMAVLGVGGVLVLVGLALAVRQTAKPVRDLAANARAFADRLDAPDLPESGAEALRDLATAFNHMKARIRDLVNERTRLLAAIAHDLRTYLTRLRLRADMIADPDQRARAERDLENMSALIEDTLLFSRASAGHADADGGCELGEEVKHFVASRTEFGEQISLVRLDGKLQVKLSPVACKRVLSNLVDNALRYGNAARISAFTEGEQVVLRVDDDGPGIPDAALERVTAPFERLEPSRGRESGGSGLGLAIVRALVEAHGGSLILRNRPGGGLSVEARLKKRNKMEAIRIA